MLKRLSKSKYRKLCEYIYERDVYCQICGNPNNLTPHHVIHRSQGGGDSKDNIVALCVYCHGDIHQHKVSLPDKVVEMLEGERYSWLDRMPF